MSPRRFALAAVLTLTWLCGTGLAQEPADKPAPKVTTYLVEFRGKPWAAVFEWLTDQTGLPFVSPNAAPTGTINVIIKKDRRYSLGEVIDLINDGLLAKKYVLVRRPTSFLLHPADEKLPRELVTRVRLDELPERGQSEIVEIVLPLKNLKADEYAAEAKRLMGPFSEVVPLRQGNRLVLVDSVANLRRVLALTRDIEEERRPEAVVAEVIPLAQFDALKAAEVLRGMFPASKAGAPAIDADLSRNAILLKGTAEQVRDVKTTLRTLDGSTDNFRVITLPQANAATVAELLRQLLNRPVEVNGRTK